MAGSASLWALCALLSIDRLDKRGNSMSYPFHRPVYTQAKLRSQDQIVRQVIWDYPLPPRIVADLWYPTRNFFYRAIATCAMLFTASLLVIIPYLLNLSQRGIFWQTPTALGFVILGPITFLVLWYLVIHPLYDWRVGLQFGRLARATVTSIETRPAPNSVRGTWQVWLDGHSFITAFRQFALEPDTWVQNLSEGDQVNVLLHPTRDKVLLAYGP